MLFPVLLYRVHPNGVWPLMGTAKRHQITTAHNADELAALLDAGKGWFVPGAAADDAADDAPADDNAPPTRKELMAEARRLGIRFGPRTSDAKLLEAINAAHGEG